MTSCISCVGHAPMTTHLVKSEHSSHGVLRLHLPIRFCSFKPCFCASNLRVFHVFKGLEKIRTHQWPCGAITKQAHVLDPEASHHCYYR